ncbi:MAG: YIP1 family protein [Rhodobacteraceae bacterium]|nr:YIP1 family protein [Paracoccaceae bacterium]
MIALARATVEDPRGGAARVMKLGIDRGTLIEALLFVAVASVIVTNIADAVMTARGAVPSASPLFANPILTAVIMAVLLIGSAVAVHAVGRAFGGLGDLDGALAITVWLQLLMLAVQLLQLGVALLLPGLAALIGLLALGFFVWLFINFVAELHDFKSLGLVLAGTIASVFAIAFVLTIVLAILGVDLTRTIPDV